MVGIAGFSEHLHPNVGLSLKFTDDFFPVNQFIGSPAHGECEFCFFSLVAPNEKEPQEKRVSCFFDDVFHHRRSVKTRKDVEIVEVVEVLRPRCQRSEIGDERSDESYILPYALCPMLYAIANPLADGCLP